MALIASVEDCKTTLSIVSYFIADMDLAAMRKYCEDMYTTLTKNFSALDEENALYEYLQSADDHELRRIIRYLYSTLRRVHADELQGNSYDTIRLSWR